MTSQDEPPTTFTCPTCGTTLPAPAGGAEGTCPTCNDSFAMQHRQQCPSCGAVISAQAPADNCPDCDAPLPPATVEWVYATPPGLCPACGRELDRGAQGSLQCPRCQFTRRFEQEQGKWVESLRPLTCACGREIKVSQTPTTCPGCGQQHRLNPGSGRWEEVETFTRFTCPTCGNGQNILLRAHTATCPVCAESFELQCGQQCPGCGMKHEGREALAYCPDCDTRLPEATSSWACTTPLANCPTCNHTWERRADGTLACPHCETIRMFNRESLQWEVQLPPFRCSCGMQLRAAQSPASCPSCKTQHWLNPASGRWEKMEIDFTCPTCGSMKKISPDSLTTICDTCKDSYSRKYQQQCSGCGITLTNDSPATHCPDCDSPLPEALPSWICTTHTGNCRYCGHKLELISPGHQKCPHCQYSREFDKDEQGWYYTLRPNTCSCGHSYTPLESPHTCPKCARQYSLDSRSGKWEEVITHTDFCCPDCQEHLRLPLDAKQATCPCCGSNFVRRLVQTCTKCHNVVVNGHQNTPCENCGTTLPEAKPGWVCTTSPGKCPVCGTSIKRNTAENKLQCPTCMMLRSFNRNTRSWENLYSQATCACGSKMPLSGNPATCPHCKRQYKLNTSDQKWYPLSTNADTPQPPQPQPTPTPTPRPAPQPEPPGGDAPPPHRLLAWSALVLTLGMGLHDADYFYLFALLFSFPAVVRAREAGKVKENGTDICREASDEARTLSLFAFGLLAVLVFFSWLLS